MALFVCLAEAIIGFGSSPSSIECKHNGTIKHLSSVAGDYTSYQQEFRRANSLDDVGVLWVDSKLLH